MRPPDFYYDSVIDISIVKWLNGKLQCKRIPPNVMESYIRNGDSQSIRWLVSSSALLPDGVVVMLIDRGDVEILKLVLDSYTIRVADCHPEYAERISRGDIADYLSKRMYR